MKAGLVALKVLAEPNRLHIVELLREKPHTVGEIVTRLKIRQPQASKHLHVLSQAKIVEVRPIAQQRVYALLPEPFKDLDSWLESYKHLWEQRFDRLDNYLAKLQKEKQHDRKK
jgi:DNA-binding transcriptional ArsR family regulator